MLLLVLLAGCSEAPVERSESEPPTPLGSAFNAADTGILAGRITWEGALPQIAPLLSPRSPSLPPPRESAREWPNPFRPLIDDKTHGLADVIVFLREVDPKRSRPWNHPPARVEQRDFGLSIHQGEGVSRTGFVRRGESADMASIDVGGYLLRARGAAFFTLSFPDANQVRRWTLDRSGVVELTGGAGRFWMRGFLFVSEHPYITRTNTTGDFTLEQVPDGDYELVVWMPHWQVERVECDPSWCLASRVTFRSPLELSRRVRVRRGEMVPCNVQISTALASREDDRVEYPHEKSSSP